MKPIETAAEFYREIKRRGLHLRKQNGRDNALLRELTLKLGCPETQLQHFLDDSEMSAEAFLREFLQLAVPFASMFQEIWEYLSQHLATATETISIRFGFENTADQHSIDLEHFRRHIETSQRIFALTQAQVWPSQVFNSLFGIGQKLLGIKSETARELYTQHGRYYPGKLYDLPIVSNSAHPIDDIIKEVHKMFNYVISEYVNEWNIELRARKLPELIEPNSDIKTSLKSASILLTDLLPAWYYIFANYNNFSLDVKNDAFHEYEDKMKPLLSSQPSVVEIPLLEAINVLDLPFWRDRWHTYEVWATILTLRSLEKYTPVLKNEKGIIPIDGYSTAIIANLQTLEYPSACVAIQVQTPFKKGKRKAIKPDLRICFDDPRLTDNTAGVIEFKQRVNIDDKTLTEIGIAYSEGCPNSAGVIIINYDVTGTRISLPSKIYLIEGVHPFNRNSIELFQQQLSDILLGAGLTPINGTVMLLLDVSSSMGISYKNRTVQDFLRAILKIPRVKILRFNDGLIEGGDLDIAIVQSLTTSGNTQLGQALLKIESTFGLPNKLLIVTDGQHDNPQDILSRIPNMRQCLPIEIGNHIDWLRNSSK